MTPRRGGAGAPHVRMPNAHSAPFLQRQQGDAAEQALRALRPADGLAEAMGALMGRGALLLRRLPAFEAGSPVTRG